MSKNNISSNAEQNNDQDICEIGESSNIINMPRNMNTNRNDLSVLELSIASSKYTLSGDDMLSNLSFSSQGVNTKTTGSDDIIISGHSSQTENNINKIKLNHSNLSHISTLLNEKKFNIGSIVSPRAGNLKLIFR
jgi:hypothetical protein